MINYLLGLDSSILLWIQEFVRNAFLTPVFVIITRLGNSGAIWLVISVIMLLFKKSRKAGIMSLAALLGSFIIDNMLLKNLVARIRPYEVIGGLQLLIEKQSDFSFPSGHTGSSFAAAVILYRELPKKWGIPALVLAALIGFSRLYLGVHYPTDVICGALIGSLIAVTVRRIFYYMRENGALKGMIRYLE